MPRFGVNYVPSNHWWHLWQDWNRASLQADLENIAALGMDRLRIHCRWPYFQPNPNRVSKVAVARLVELLEQLLGTR